MRTEIGTDPKMTVVYMPDGSASFLLEKKDVGSFKQTLNQEELNQLKGFLMNAEVERGIRIMQESEAFG